jgi:hypothetical protein
MADLVVLHYEHDSSEVLVNRDQIAYIERYNGGAAIYLQNGKSLTVKESLTAIWKSPAAPGPLRP